MKPITSSDWIPFSIKLPANRQEVLMLYSDGVITSRDWSDDLFHNATHWMPTAYLPRPEPPKPAEDPEFVKWWCSDECFLANTIRVIGGRNISRKDAKAIWDSIKASGAMVGLQQKKAAICAKKRRNPFENVDDKDEFNYGWDAAINWVNEGMP